MRTASALAAVAAFLVGCSTNGATGSSTRVATADGGLEPTGTDDDDAAATALGARLASLGIGSGALVPDFDPTITEYTATSLTSLFPTTVTATTSDPAATLIVHGAPAQSGAPIGFTLQPREDVTVVVQSTTGATATYTIHYSPPELPPYAVTTSGPGAGGEKILLDANATIFMVDRAGAPVYYRTFPEKSVEDFQRHVLPSGDVFYSTLVGTFDKAGWTLGVSHVMDAQLRDVADYDLVANREHGVLPSEGHDFLLLGDQHYVTETYLSRTVDLSGIDPSWSSQAPVETPIVQEVDHGAVVFEWDAADFPALYAQSVDGNAFTSDVASDYLHLNSLDVDPRDGNVILSFRHADEIVKVDRKTAQILWTLGGKGDDFGITADQRFSHQHHVKVQSDGSLLVFDNGNGAHQSRVLSFVLDEGHESIASFRVVYDKPADQPQTSFMGSATRFDGDRYLIGWGGWSTTAIAPAVTEIVAGQVVWSLTITTPSLFSYRALTSP